MTNAGGLIKPKMLKRGDTVAVISPSWGCAGAPRVRWQYKLGVKRLEVVVRLRGLRKVYRN